MNLFPYQIEGAKWLSPRKTALLADEMGLGKTAQAIAGADDALLERVLVICPAVAVANWEAEFRKFSFFERPFKVIRSSKDQIPRHHSVVISYDLAVRFHEKKRLAGPWDLLVLDEAHFLKSIDAKRTWAVMGSKGIVRSADRVWALTGTPQPNHVGELWVLLYTFGATRLDYDSFVRRYCRTYEGPYGLQITGSREDRRSELHAMLDKIMLRRRKAQVLKDMPPITFSDVVVDKSRIDFSLIPSFQEEALLPMQVVALKERLAREERFLKDSIDRVGPYNEGLLTVLEATAPSVSTLRRYIGCLKVAATAEMVDYELSHNRYEKIVIFAVHRDVINGLAARLAKYRPLVLHGGTSIRERPKQVEEFQKNKKRRVFIGNIRAAGTAITLTASNHVLFVEQSWTPADNAQAAMRVHRIGQKHPVEVRFVGLAGSIDEHVAYTLRRKITDIVAVIDKEQS